MVEYSYYLTIYLYPKWGDEINYNNFAPITNDFHKSDLITQASKLVDYIKVMSYDYTGVLDILPGSITPTNWYEKVIQYYISKVQDRNKIIMGINTESYQWPEREVAINPILNYSFLKKEAEIIPRDFFKEFIRQNSMKKESEFNIDEDVFKFTKENKSFIAIMPSDEQIANQVKIAGEYGVYGIFYK